MSKRRGSGSSLGCLGEVIFLVFAAILLFFVKHPVLAFIIVPIFVFILFNHWANKDDNSSSDYSTGSYSSSIPRTSQSYSSYGHSSGSIDQIVVTTCSSSRSSSHYSRPSPRISAVKSEYRLIANKHAALDADIKAKYQRISDKNDLYSKKMNEVVELCKQDISIAEKYTEYANKLRSAEIADGTYRPTSSSPNSIRRYESLYRLAVIYGKRKDYASAIAVCDEAIRLGYTIENKNTSVNDRRERMYRLWGKPAPDEPDCSLKIPAPAPPALKPSKNKTGFPKFVYLSSAWFKVAAAERGYIVFDFETTGLDCDDDRIIEIGAIKYTSFHTLIDRFSRRVNPGIHIPYRATEINGITDSMVASCPPISDVLPEFLDFIGDYPIIAHNANRFDILFLKAEIRRNNIKKDVTIEYGDSLPMARESLKNVQNHKLGTLADYFNVYHGDAHSARCDCTALAGILKHLLEM